MLSGSRRHLLDCCPANTQIWERPTNQQKQPLWIGFISLLSNLFKGPTHN